MRNWRNGCWLSYQRFGKSETRCKPIPCSRMVIQNWTINTYYIFTYYQRATICQQKLWRGELEETCEVTDSINNKFDVPKEFMIRMKTISVFNIYVITSFTVDHLGLSIGGKSEALYFRSSNYSTMTETQTYAESLVQHTPSVGWTNSTLHICYFHDHRDCCTKCYNKATMDRIVNDEKITISLSNVH